MQHENYDVLIVGARVAGAATATFLAAAGFRVLLIDQRQPGEDTLSTHALMRTAVMQLGRLGVLPRIRASGAQAIWKTTFAYGEKQTTLEWTREKGALLAPRRTVLDETLVEAATRAGAQVRFGCKLRGLVFEKGRPRVARITDAQGNAIQVKTSMLVGADGVSSQVAQLCKSQTLRTAEHSAATLYGYVPFEHDGYCWTFQRETSRDPALSGGLIPTNDGMSCIFLASNPRYFVRYLRARPHESLFEKSRELFPAELAARISQGAVDHIQLQYFLGRKGFLRQCVGPGWALVGDAGYFKDPATAHGLSDALRDAQLLTCSLSNPGSTMSDYEATRNDLSSRLFDITNEIAALSWDYERLQELHVALASEIRREARYLSGLVPPSINELPPLAPRRLPELASPAENQGGALPNRGAPRRMRWG